MDWKHLLAYITGTVDQKLLLRNELVASFASRSNLLRYGEKDEVGAAGS